MECCFAIARKVPKQFPDSVLANFATCQTDQTNGFRDLPGSGTLLLRSRPFERDIRSFLVYVGCGLGLGAPPILVYFSGWIGRGYDLDFDPWLVQSRSNPPFSGPLGK